MTTKDYLHILQTDIHTTIFATLAADGHPQVRAIDVMLADENSIYFLTAKGKEFYRQLTTQNFVALSGVKDGVSISLRGAIRKAESALLDEVFKVNPYMADLYPGDTRSVLEVFQLYEGQGEYFDLNQKPVFRESFTLGDAEKTESGYFVTDDCIGCKLCHQVCPQKCITITEKPVVIQQEHCLHCGRCAEVCPQRAIIRQGR